VTLRTRKFIRNPLLGRKQMVVCVTPSVPSPSRQALLLHQPAHRQPAVDYRMLTTAITQ